MPVHGGAVRSAELRLIRRMIRSESDPVLVFVGGEGSGKSALLHAARRQELARTFHLRANPAEGGWPYSGIHDVLSRIPGEESRSLARRLPGAGGDTQAAFAVARELLELIRGQHSVRTLVLLDDVDLMDEESQVVMGYVGRRLATSRVRICATASTLDPKGPFANLRTVTLKPLSRTAARGLVAEVVGKQSPAFLQEWVVRAGNGMPQMLLELVDAIPAGQLSGREPLVLPLQPGPSGLRSAERVFAGLSPAAGELLKLLSLGMLTPVAVIDALPEYEDAVAELLSGKLIGRVPDYYSFEDRTARAAVLSSLDSTKRLELHRQSLELLEGAGPLAEDFMAWHASFLRTEDGLAERLLHAGQRLLQRGWADQGVELAQRALRLGAEGEIAGEALTGIAEGLIAQGEVTAVRHYISEARRATVSPEVHALAASLELRLEFLTTQLATSSYCLGVAERLSEFRPIAGLEVLLASAFHFAERWRISEAKSLLAKAKDLAGIEDPRHDAAPRPLRLVSALIAGICGDPTLAGRCYDEFEAAGDALWEGQELILLGYGLCYAGRHAEARRVTAYMAQREQLIPPLWGEVGKLIVALNEERAGNFFGAFEAVEALQESARDDQLLALQREVLNAWYWQLKNEPEQSEAHGKRLRELIQGGMHPVDGARYAALLGSAILAQGHADRALPLLRDASAFGRELPNPGLLRCEADLAECLVGLGRAPEAREVVRRFEAQATLCPSDWSTAALGRAKALVASDENAQAFFRHALNAARGADLGFERARTLLASAARLQPLGLEAEARRAWEQARLLFQELGADSWLAGAERQASQGDRFAGSAAARLLRQLTPVEWEVAGLVVRGFRNKDIAMELFVSLRTVEVRLTSIYRKLQIKSRSQLSALVAAERRGSGSRPLT